MSDEWEKRLYNMKEAADYLGMHEQTLRYHMKKGHIKYDVEMGRMLIFFPETLDAFKAERREAAGITAREIAEIYDVDRTVVYYHEKHGNITRTGLRSRSVVYDPDDVYNLAVRLRWVKPVEESQSSER